MSVQPKTRYTLEEYLDLERRSFDVKHEYLDGEVFAMGGASWAHALISTNLVYSLESRLRGGPCRIAASDLRVKVSSTRLYTYPDLVVVCGTPEIERPGDTLINPNVIIEILSDTTEAYDRGRKFEHYRSLATLNDYLLVSQSEILTEHYNRQANGRWIYVARNRLEDALSIETIDCELPLAEIYEGVPGLGARQG